VVAVESACATESAADVSVALLQEPMANAIAANPMNNVFFFILIFVTTNVWIKLFFVKLN
jgi:hypothetical protein